jgi:hypothetical protein
MLVPFPKIIWFFIFCCHPQGMLLVYGVVCDNVFGIDVGNDIVAFCVVLQSMHIPCGGVREAIVGTLK